MSAWLIDHGQPAAAPRLHALRRKLKGPHKAAIELVYRVAESELTLELELRAGDPQLHVRLKGTWFQRGSPETGLPTLRLALPLALTSTRARYEIPFGAIDRLPNAGQEVPALQWGRVTGKRGGKAASLLLATDCKHGYALNDNRWTLTLIRSAYMPDPLPEIGQHDVRMRLLPSIGDAKTSECIDRADRLNRPLRVVGTDTHQGTLAQTGRFFAVEPDNVVIAAVKKGEDDDALVLRLCEVRGRDTIARVRFDPQLFGAPMKAESVDLLERTSGRGRVGLIARNGAISAQVPAHGLASVRLNFGRTLAARG
jgi:alpha-mannosidase